MSDYWSPYEKFIPAGLHTQSKAETYTVEGYNSLFRHFLARLRRKSKYYSKSKEMLSRVNYLVPSDDNYDGRMNGYRLFFQMLFFTITFSFYFNNTGMMNNAVYCCYGH